MEQQIIADIVAILGCIMCIIYFSYCLIKQENPLYSEEEE